MEGANCPMPEQKLEDATELLAETFAGSTMNAQTGTVVRTLAYALPALPWRQGAGSQASSRTGSLAGSRAGSFALFPQGSEGSAHSVADSTAEEPTADPP